MIHATHSNYQNPMNGSVFPVEVEMKIFIKNAELWLWQRDLHNFPRLDHGNSYKITVTEKKIIDISFFFYTAECIKKVKNCNNVKMNIRWDVLRENNYFKGQSNMS